MISKSWLTSCASREGNSRSCAPSRCPNCHQLVFFENSECLSCGTALAFDPDRPRHRRPARPRPGPLRQPGAGRLQLAGRRRQSRKPVPFLPSDQDPSERRRPGRQRRDRSQLRGHRGSQATARLPTPRARSAHRVVSREARRRPGLRPVVERGRAGHHRTRRRGDHRRPGRVRRRSPRSGSATGWASPTAPCSATSATRSATTTGRPWSSPTRPTWPDRGSCSATIGPTMPRP